MFSTNASQVSTAANYIEDVFSTYLYTGTGANRTITNGINLSTNGGLVWMKCRSGASTDHALYDTARGATLDLASNNTTNQVTRVTGLTSFGSTGFSIGSLAKINVSAATFASWTFRKQAKFFDVVTYTGTGSARTIAHNLGSVPGCIIVKRTDSAGNWQVYHRSLTSASYGIQLNLTSAEGIDSSLWNSTAPTSTVFSVGANLNVNDVGGTYVAYIFAHNAGGFGLTGNDNVISCGNWTNNSGGRATVSLGYEPQLVLIKPSSTTGDWQILDNMRGWVGTDATSSQALGAAFLAPNLSNAEANTSFNTNITPNGFQVDGAGASRTYIYIAIRRGPMKTPTSGTSVFAPNAVADDTGPITTNFPVDMFFDLKNTAVSNRNVFDRLRGNGVRLFPNLTDPDDVIGVPAQLQSNTTVSPGVFGAANAVIWSFRRAPSFFDEVCYTGTGAAATPTHNLTVVPELIIVKRRNVADEWTVRAAGTTGELYLNRTNAQDSSFFYLGAPTSTTFNLLSGGSQINGTGSTYVAYLFATCPGVSKVGSYTGTGATQTINCGFTGGARFVLIKRTDTTGDWYVWDTARGMVAGTDPSLLLNSTAAQVNANSVYTTGVGFQIVSTAAGINASGGSYIFLAIA